MGSQAAKSIKIVNEFSSRQKYQNGEWVLKPPKVSKRCMDSQAAKSIKIVNRFFNCQKYQNIEWIIFFVSVKFYQ